MSIWGRLGNVIKSYLNADGNEIFRGSASKTRTQNGGDPDLDVAYEELDDFLRKDTSQQGREEGGGMEARNETAGGRRRPVPIELRKDFAELGFSRGASAEECKAAYKNLLKLHHPDRHAGDAEAIKTATEKAVRVNAAYSRLEKWFNAKS